MREMGYIAVLSIMLNRLMHFVGVLHQFGKCREQASHKCDGDGS